MTQEVTIEYFCRVIKDFGVEIDPDDVVESRATLDDYKTGAAKKSFDEGDWLKIPVSVDGIHIGDLWRFSDVKPRPSSVMGNLYVMENSAKGKDLEKTFSYFDGVA